MKQNKKIKKIPLYHVYEKDNIPIDQYLIVKGANIEAKDNEAQRSNIHFSSDNGHIQIVQYLVEKVANFEDVIILKLKKEDIVLFILPVINVILQLLHTSFKKKHVFFVLIQ